MSDAPSPLVPELSVTDIQKSLDFYLRVLGFSIEFQREEEGFAYIRLGKAEIMLDEIGQTRTWKTGEFEYPLGRGINLFIEVEKVDLMLTKLEENSTPLFLPVEEKWYRVDDREEGSKQFIVQDPDGYLLRFSEYMGERPSTQ